METVGSPPTRLPGDDELGTSAAMTSESFRSFELGPMPLGRPMETVDERLVRAPVAVIFELASKVEQWPAHLPHYRHVRFRERRLDGGGIVDMSANRPFQISAISGVPLRINWPTWWLSEMAIDPSTPSIRFRHIGGITTGMDVEWSFTPAPGGTHVRILHLWDGPRIPALGIWAAMYVIGPVFVHGIASRTLEGLAAVAEREARNQW